MGRCLRLNNWLIYCLVLAVAILATYSARDMFIYQGLYRRAALFFSPSASATRASVPRVTSSLLPSTTTATRFFSHTPNVMAANEEHKAATASPADITEQAQQTSSSTSTENNKSTPLALPAAPQEGALKLDVSGAGGSVKLDHLGPLVVNQDGSLSRISNWDKMTEIEKKNTLRVLGKRNQQRLEALKAANNGNAGEKIEG